MVCNCAPPDTNGEVGLDQYVQIVNEGFQVFNKNTGASLLGPVAIASLWNGFGGLCENNGFGDPVVLFDQLANRWVITQFAGNFPATPITDQCIAVSTSSDATGTFARYALPHDGQLLRLPEVRRLAGRVLREREHLQRVGDSVPRPAGVRLRP